MTKEKLKKEAKEYAEEHRMDLIDYHDSISMEDAYIAGYNKANEWHYVKDGDLPNNQRIVEVFTKDKDVFIAYLDSEGKEWSTGRYFRKVLSMDYIITWKEIVLPKE